MSLFYNMADFTRLHLSPRLVTNIILHFLYYLLSSIRKDPRCRRQQFRPRLFLNLADFTNPICKSWMPCIILHFSYYLHFRVRKDPGSRLQQLRSRLYLNLADFTRLHLSQLGALQYPSFLILSSWTWSVKTLVVANINSVHAY